MNKTNKNNIYVRKNNDMKREKKIKLIQYGDVTKLARLFECSDTTVRTALTNKANTELSSRIRDYVRKYNVEFPYVEY
jgi:hypothetical protein